MARKKRKNNNEETQQQTISYDYSKKDANGSVGLSEKAQKALDTGTYGKMTNRTPQATKSEDQVKIANPTPVPALNGMAGASNNSTVASKNQTTNTANIPKTSVNTDRARAKYAQRIGYTPLQNTQQEVEQESARDKNYVVKRKRYDKLMQDTRLANDIKKLAELNYKNANTDATVSQEWADEYGAKKITGGFNKKQFVDTLSRRYGLTPQELGDMALTFHSDAYNKEVEQFGNQLEDFSEAHPVVGSLGSFIGTLGSGVEGAYNAAVGTLTGDDRFLSDMFRTTKNSPREGAKKNIESDIGKGAYDIGMGVGDMAVGAAAGSAPAILAGNTANEALNSAIDRGSSVRKASVYGAGAGALDYITNKIGLDKAKELAVDSIKSAGVKKFLTQNAIAGLGEAGENVIQDIGQSFIDSVLNGKNSEWNTSMNNKIASGMSESDALKETAKEYVANLAMSAGIGFGMGSAMQGGRTLLGKVPTLNGMNNTAPATNEALVDLLASDNKYKAMFTANTGIQLGNSVEENKAIISDYLLNAVGQKKIGWKAPSDFDAEKANISNQIDRLENGELKPSDYIQLGETPRYMEEYGDVNNPLVMRQRDARKIIQSGGDNHGLGKDGLESIPEQFNNPVAVMSSLTQPNSGVIMTDMLDNDGNPVIVPVHMDKSSGKNTINTVPSMYGKEGIEHLLNNSDIAFENKERVRNTLNENGVQFSNRKVQNDPFFNSNVTSGENNVNIESVENHPRYVKPLEGADLDNANIQRKSNQDAITRLKTEISILEKDPNNLYRGNLKKAVQAEINAKKAEISKLQASNRSLDKSIKGGITSVKDILTAEQKNNIYDTSGKYDSVFSQINLATKFAGDTPEAKDLAKRAQAAIREYINTGSMESVREIGETLGALDNLAKTTNATYTTKKGNQLTYESRFGDQAQYLSKLKPVTDIYESEKVAARAAQSAPQNTSEPEGIKVYRGYNRSDNPLESNLAKQKSIYDVIGREDPNTPTMLPLEFYTESVDDAQMYANHDKDFYEGLRRLAESDYFRRTAEKGESIPNKDAFIKESMDESYRVLTGREPIFDNSHVDELTINPQKVLDLTSLGETTTVDNIYDLLSDLTGILRRRSANSNDLDIDDILRFGDLDYDLNEIPTYRILRNQGGSDETGTRFVDFMRNNGYDAVKYKESGANHYALLNNGESERVPADMDVQTDEHLSNDEIDEINRRLEEDATRDFETDDNGNVPPNEPPVPPEEPPVPQNSISRRYDTLKNSDLFTKSEANMKMLENAKEQGVFNKDVESRQKSQAEALKEYLADEEGVTKKNFEREWDSGKDVDTAMLVLHDALDSGNQSYTNLALLKQAIQGKKAGRILRGMRDYAYSGTKEGTLSKVGDFLVDKAEKVLNDKKTGADYNTMAEKAVNGDMSFVKKLGMDETNANRIIEAINNGASEQDISTMLAMYKAVGTTGVSQEALDKVSQLYEQIEKVPPTSKARADLEADVFKVLAQDVGGKRTWHEQWDAWRYLAMLGNPKTHLRNILGNTTHRMVTETKDIIGALIEEGADRYSKRKGGQGIDRTKALLNANDKGLVDLARQDADNVAYTSLNDAGNKYNVKNEINRARNSFNNKALSKVDDFNSNLLDMEDYSALKNKYSKSLARFLKANGADESIFNATDDASKALLDKGRAYAVDQAKQATFHEYSKLAEAMTQFSQKMQEGEKLSQKATGYVLEGLVPFKKTPINILKQAIKYSPVELVKSVGKMVKAVKGGENPSDAIESLASGMTGSMIYGLGALLASQGLLTGGQDENYTVDNAETEQGKQNYAIKIGDNSYTLDWLAPMALPLFAGAETYDYYQRMKNGDDIDAFDAVIDGLSTIAEPITEMSMLQGINNTLENLSYSGLKSAIGTFGTTALTGYLTQGVPTLAGQFARAIDDTRRSTYTDKENAVKRQLDKTATKIENKIPFLSQTNEPYVDTRGQVQQNEGLASYLLGNNFGTRLIDQMVSPGYFKHGTVDDVDRELNRLYEIDPEHPMYRKVSNGKVGDTRLSKEDFTKYQTLYGQTTDELYQDIVKSDSYKGLDDAHKIKMLKSAQDLAKNLSDSEIGGKVLDNSSQNLVDLYKNEGVEAVTKYLADKQAADALDLKYDTYVKKEAEQPGGAVKYAETKKEAQNVGFVNKNGNVDTKGYEKAISQAGAQSQKFTNDLPALQGMGLEKPAYYVYAHAINQHPELTPNEFAETYNEINTNKENKLTQAEMLAYINEWQFSDDPDEDARIVNDIWNTYNDGSWKQVPYLKKDGTWGKKKK